MCLRDCSDATTAALCVARSGCTWMETFCIPSFVAGTCTGTPTTLCADLADDEAACTSQGCTWAGP
jgi:hypothetical protein